MHIVHLFFSYAIVYNNSVELFADIRKFSDDIINLLAENQVKIYPYEGIYRKVSEMTSEDKLLLDSSIMNYSLYQAISKEIGD